MDPLDLEAAQKAYEARQLIQQDRGRRAVGHAIAGSVVERCNARPGTQGPSAVRAASERHTYQDSGEATAIEDLLVAETDHGSTTVAPPAGLLSCVPSTPHDASAAADATAAAGNSGPTHDPTTGSIERGQKVRASELYAKYHSGDALKNLLSAEEELKSSNASNASTASGSSSGSTESTASAVSAASAAGTTSCAKPSCAEPSCAEPSCAKPSCAKPCCAGASSASASGAAAAPAAAAWVFDFSGPKTHLAALGSAAPAVSSTALKIAPEVRPQTPRTVARLQAARSAAKALESALSADLSADEARRGATGASNASSDAAAGRAMALAILGGETLVGGGHAVEAAAPTAADSPGQHDAKDDGSILGTARQRAITMRAAAVAKRAQAERAAAAAAASLSAAEAAEAAAAGAEFALMMLMGDDFGDDGALPLVAPPATG